MGPLEDIFSVLREELGQEPEAVFASFDPEPLGKGKDKSLRQYEMHQSTIFLVKGDGDLSALVVKQDGTVDNFKLMNPNIRHICDLRYPYALVTTAPEMEYIAVKFNLSEKKVEKMAMMNKRKIFKEILDYDGVGHD